MKSWSSGAGTGALIAITPFPINWGAAIRSSSRQLDFVVFAGRCEEYIL